MLLFLVAARTVFEICHAALLCVLFEGRCLFGEDGNQSHGSYTCGSTIECEARNHPKLGLVWADPTSGRPFDAQHAVALTSPTRSVVELVDGPVEVREVAAGFTFTEGPASDRNGDVFFTDIPQEEIHVWRAATGRIELWLEKTDKINGLFFRPDGGLVGCQMGSGRRVVVIDPVSKAITPLAERIDGKRFNAPNDLVIDAQGGVWFTDLPMAARRKRRNSMRRRSIGFRPMADLCGRWRAGFSAPMASPCRLMGRCFTLRIVMPTSR